MNYYKLSIVKNYCNKIANNRLFDLINHRIVNHIIYNSESDAESDATEIYNYRVINNIKKMK